MTATEASKQDLLSAALRASLRCPICRAPLEHSVEKVYCTRPDCAGAFPTVRGIPILLNERRSVFRIADVLNDSTLPQSSPKGTLAALLGRALPTISSNPRARRNLKNVSSLLVQHSAAPRVLVVGSGTIGEGLETLVEHPAIELVETDVALGPRVSLVCDAHDLPFEDAFFDGIVVQAVLEHVVDPYRCAEEIHRVLKPGGIVYAETPFMQQVHLRQFDFTRFTHLGHRRLFRRFQEIESGVSGGPGMALAWSYLYFLLSFSTSRTIRRVLKAFAMVTSFPLKYVDQYLMDKPGSFDAASGYYFIGRKGDRALADAELIRLYRGAT